jgi:hypothetical protein
MRKTEGCLNCGEVREMAAHGFCFRCYRQNERAQERPIVDRHNPAMRKEHKKILRGFTSLMVGLSDLGVGKSDALAIREIIQPYLDPIANFLAPGPGRGEREGRVNSERDSEKMFTYNKAMHDQEKEG